VLPETVITYHKETKTFSHPNATASGGTYTLNLEPDPSGDRLKDVYSITIAASNDPDSTWSYDSLYLNVYRTDALSIQINGESKTEHAMSNVDKIRNMTSEEILDLHRHITLYDKMSINYNELTDMGELMDQFTWRSSDPSVGSILMAQNGIIADIDDFGYASYQPRQGFILSGDETGKTVITATHARTGLKAELDVTVETLRDKLYLFQFYPKTETKFTYKDGLGNEKTFTTNANGQFALFEENGIKGDVYVTSTFNGTTYTGVLDYRFLKTKEQSPSTMELYPVNILQLRQLAKVEAFFKTEDLKPYIGQVTYRGAVIKNGYYCEPSEIGGSGVTVNLGVDGKLEILFDTTTFYSIAAGEPNAATLSAQDKVEFVIEVQFQGDRYYPVLLTFDGNLNEADRVIIGDKIVTLDANPGMEKVPFMVNQFVYNPETGDKISILQYTGKFGPNNQFPSIMLITEFMWWGSTVQEQDAHAILQTEYGQKPEGQSYQTFRYPFSEESITRHVQVLNKDTIWLGKAKSGPVTFRLYEAPGVLRRSVTSRAILINMIGVEEIDVSKLRSLLTKMREGMQGVSPGVQNPKNDDMIAEALEHINGFHPAIAELTMDVYPTDDPLVFRTLLYPNTGTLATTGGDSVEFFTTRSYSITPGLSDLKKMVGGSYLDESIEKINKNKSKKSYKDKDYSFALGGYLLGEIRYNPQTGSWEHVVIGGGFNAGIGVEFYKNINLMAGPIPITFTLAAGGAVEVDFKASILREQITGYPWSDPNRDRVNDYLTSARVIAYIDGFGGIGADYTVVAAKIGVYGRLSIEHTSTWLNREYLLNSEEHRKFGNKLTLEGMVGIRAVVKLLFVNFNYDFASYRYNDSWIYNNWQEIYDYWNKYANSPLTADNLDVAIAAYLEHIGVDETYVFESQTIESRDYLGRYERSWNEGMPLLFGRMSATSEGETKVLQSNAYPYSNPQLVQDGSLMVYMSDGNSMNVEDTVASWAEYNGSGYTDRGPISTDPALAGYGDSGLKVAGEGDQIAAVWVRQMQSLDKEAGEEVTNADIILMSNSVEVMAAIYDGESWTTYRLTNNGTPDLGPVVSVADGKVFVAYRNVYAGNPDNPLDYSAYDTIWLTVYDMATKTWSDAKMIYNGTNGNVMGLSIASLSDGTTAVVYNVNQGVAYHPLEDGELAGKDHQIVYTVLDPSGNVRKNLQITNDEDANDNPQVTSVRFPDHVERFVIAWHAVIRHESGDLQHNIRFAAVNPDGEVYPDFVNSLEMVWLYNDVKFSPNFTFVRLPNACKELQYLSLLWKQPETELNEEQIITRDTVKAVQFRNGDGGIYLSGAIDVATMPDYTEIDTITAILRDHEELAIEAVLLGTTYTSDVDQIGSITPDNADDEIPLYISQTVSDMYTVRSAFQNKFEVELVYLNPREIVPGFDLPIQFHLVNQGISPIEQVEITVDGQTTHFEEVGLLPNANQVFVVYYAVPENITDIDYEVRVVYEDGDVLISEGQLHIDKPDLGIATIRMKEEGGKRILSVPIYNLNDTRMDGKGRSVKLALYRDITYSDEQRIGDVITISNDQDLALIDQAGFVTDVTVDVKEYLASLALSEIPDEGIMLYAKVWAEDENGALISEFEDHNNTAQIVIENLSSKYHHDDVLLTLEQRNLESSTMVELTMQNMNMAPITNGNVLLQLLDQQGNMVESKYLATSAEELLTFDSEEIIRRTVYFAGKGESVQATFFIESADAMDATLSALTLEGIIVEFDPGQTHYALEAKDLRTVRLTAAAANSKSLLTLMDAHSDVILSNQGFVSIELPLAISTTGAVNTFQILVEPESDAAPAVVYHLTIINTLTDAPKLQLMAVGPTNKDGDFVDRVNVVVPQYDVDWFQIEKLRYKVNDGVWSEVPYDGKFELVLETFTELGVYAVMAKVILASGLEYELEPLQLSIVTGDLDVHASTVSVDKAKLIADGQETLTVTVKLVDSYDHVLPDREVILLANSDRPVIETLGDGLTDENGEIVFQVTSTKAEIVQLTAKDADSGISLAPVRIEFLPGAVNKHESSVDVSPSVVAVDSSGAMITVTLRDEFGNAIEGKQVKLTADSATASVSPSVGSTDRSGKVTFRVSDMKAETVSLTVTEVESATDFDPVEVIFVPGAPSSISFIGVSKTIVKADGEDSATVTVTVRDRFGNVVPGIAVKLSAKPAVAIIEAVDDGITDAQGEADFMLTSTHSEKVTITASFEGVSLPPVQIEFYDGAADPAFSRAEAWVASVTADGSAFTTITVTLRDRYGKYVTNRQVELVADSATTVIEALDGGITNSSGKAVFRVSNTKAETVEYIARDVGSGNVLSPVRITFIAGEPDAGRSEIVAQPSSVVADGIDAATITITVRDAHDNIVSGRKVSLSEDRWFYSNMKLQTVTDLNGQATFLVTNRYVETVTYTAEDGVTGTPLGSVTVEYVTGLTDAVNSHVERSAGETVASGTDTVTIKVNLRDGGGHPLTGHKVNLHANSSNVTITAVQDTTDAQGQAIFSVANTVVESVVFTAEDADDGVTLPPVTVNFVAGEPSYWTSSVTASPEEVPANHEDAAVITVTLRDAYNHPVSGLQIGLNVERIGTEIEAVNGGVTDAAGVASFRVIGWIAGEFNYTPYVVGGIRLRDVTVTFVPGNLDLNGTSITALPDKVTADGQETAQIRVNLYDTYNQPLRDRRIDIRIDGDQVGHVTVEKVNNGFTNIHGSAVFYVSGDVLQTVTITAIDVETNTELGQVLVHFVPGEPDASTSTIQVSSPQVTANGTDRSMIKVWLRDASGYAISGKQVQLSASNDRSLVTPIAGGVTNAEGMAAFWVSHDTPEVLEYTAQDGDGKVSLTAQVSFMPGALDPDASTMGISHTEVTANGHDETTVSVVLRDSNGHELSGRRVVLIADSANAAIHAVNDGVTGPDGTAVFTVRNAVIETVTLTAQDEPSGIVLPTSVQVVFTTPPVDGAQSSLAIEGAKDHVLADGNDETTIVAILRDHDGQPLGGRKVQLIASSEDAIINPVDGGITNSDGEARFKVSNLQAETVTYVAEDAASKVTVTSTVQVHFVPGEIEAAKSSIAVSPREVLADGDSEATVTVTLRDAQGHVLAGREVALTTDSSNASVDELQKITDTEGKAVFTVWSNAAETVMLTAHDVASGISFDPEPVRFVEHLIDAWASSVSVDNTNVVARAGYANITVTLRYTNGEPAIGREIELVTDSDDAFIPEPKLITDENGQAAFRALNWKVGMVNFTARDVFSETLLSQSVQVNYISNIPLKSTSALSVSKWEAKANGADEIIVTVTLRDIIENPVRGEKIYLFSNNNAVKIEAVNDGYTNDDGEAIFKLTSYVPGSMSFLASYMSFTTSFDFSPVTVEFVPDINPDKSAVLVTKEQVAADGTEQTEIIVILRNTLGRGQAGYLVTLDTDAENVNITAVNSGITNFYGETTFIISNTEIETVHFTPKEEVTGVTLESVAVRFVAGSVDTGRSSVDVSKTAVTANGVDQAVIEVTLRDAQDHLLSGRSVVIAPDGGSSVIAPSNAGITEEDGKVAFTVTNTVVETVTYTIVDEDSEMELDKISIAFEERVVDPDQSEIVASPTEVLADGQDEAKITVSLRDQSGVVMSGRTVVLEADDGESVIVVADDDTDANGQVIFTVSSNTLGTVKYTAKDAASGVSLPAVEVNYVAGVVSKLTSSIGADITEVLADGEETATIEVTLRDNAEHPISGRTVQLIADGGSSVIEPMSQTTDALGVARFTVTNEAVERVSYTAVIQSSDVELGPIEIDFVPGELDTSESEINVSSPQVTANGKDASIIKVILRDSYGHGLSGHKLKITADSANTVIDAVYKTTDYLGEASFYVFNEVVETVEYIVYDETSDVKFWPVYVSFVEGNLDVTRSGVAVSETQLLANGRDAAIITVILRDELDHPLGGRQVLLHSSSGTSVIEAVYGNVTDASGMVLFQVSDTQAGLVEFTAQDQASSQVIGSVTVNFALVIPDDTNSGVAAAPDQVLASGQHTATITVVLRGEDGDPLSGRKILLTARDGHSAITPLNEITDASGKATFTVTNTHVETVVYDAQDVASGKKLPPVEVQFIAGPVSAGKSTVGLSRAEVIADGKEAATITVTLQDAYGHLLSGRKVSVIADSDHTVIGASDSGFTNEQGMVTFMVANTEAETVTYTVIAEGETLKTVQVKFNRAAQPEPGPEPDPNPQPGPSPQPVPETPTTPAEPEEPAQVPEEDTPDNQEDSENRPSSLFKSDLFDQEAWLNHLAAKLRATEHQDLATAFTDVSDGYWAQKAISLMARLQVANGVGDGTFQPDRSITRAEFAAMLARLFNFKEPSGEPIPFADVHEHWAKDAIERLSRLGIVNGYQDGTFKPDAPITREEMIVMILRILDTAGLPQTEARNFSDLPQAGDYARDSILTAAQAGIINGYLDGSFRPKGLASRAETVTILMNLLKLIPGVQEIIKPYM